MSSVFKLKLIKLILKQLKHMIENELSLEYNCHRMDQGEMKS